MTAAFTVARWVAGHPLTTCSALILAGAGVVYGAARVLGLAAEMCERAMAS